MASITSLGSGSGLQLESLVASLMKSEKVPLTALQKRESDVESKISAYGKLKSSLSSLQSAAQALKPTATQSLLQRYATYSASVADTAVASASAKSGAMAGSYSLEVTHLAKAHKLASSSHTATEALTGAAATLTLDFGTLSGGVYTADNARQVNVSIKAGATLSDIRSAINDSGAGVSATIVHGSSGDQLVVTSKEGANSVMKMTGSGISGFNFDPAVVGAQGFSKVQDGEDATFVLDGIDITSHTNSVSTALDGVTLNLTKTNIGSPTTLTIGEDAKSGLTDAINSFVKAYNSTRTLLSSQGKYDATTKTAGELQGSYALRSASTQLSSAIMNTTSGVVGSPYQNLSNIGISVGKTGELTVDSAKLDAALVAAPDTVSKLIGNVGTAFASATDRLVGTTGSITNATSTLSKTLERLTADEEKLTAKLDKIEARYRKQFSTLDSLVSAMNNSANSITNYVSQWNKTSS